jgi:hypothetical protein
LSPEIITFRLVPQVRRNDRRALSFLEGHRDLDASTVFDSLDEKLKNSVRVSMELWVDNANQPSTRLHGFPNDKDYWMCFVFKAKEKRQHHRFYGYLYNPLPVLNPRFQLCVLCIHAMKKEKETDRSELSRVRTWYSSDAAKQAIRVVFPDREKSNQKGQVLKWTK